MAHNVSNRLAPFFVECNHATDPGDAYTLTIKRNGNGCALFGFNQEQITTVLYTIARELGYGVVPLYSLEDQQYAADGDHNV